jgi:MFS family permease
LRGLVGFGIGGSPQAITLYAEFLPQSKRARCVIINNFSWSIGAVFEVLLAVVIMPTLGWRWLLGISAVPLFIFVIFSGWLPESARFHLASGHTDLAQKTLERISNDNGVPLPEGKLAKIKVEFFLYC